MTRTLDPAALANACNQTPVDGDIAALRAAIAPLFPGLAVEHALTRGGWHRLGGVVDAKLARIAEHIGPWAEETCDGDVEALAAECADRGWYATRIEGKTHYFVVFTGEAPEAFIQVEIEELGEELDRPLFRPDWVPEDLEELLDPPDYQPITGRPVGRPYYLFRRAFDVASLLPRLEKGSKNMARFFQEWQASSAGRNTLCRHWVLAVQESIDRYGEPLVSSKAISTFPAPLPIDRQLDEGLRGVELANLILAFDKALGYPMAWYFSMVAVPAVPYALAERVLADHDGGYEYLPGRDLDILRGWRAKPYSL